MIKKKVGIDWDYTYVDRRISVQDAHRKNGGVPYLDAHQSRPESMGH